MTSQNHHCGRVLGVLSVSLGDSVLFPEGSGIYSCSVVEKSLKFVGGGVVDLDACLLEDALELIRLFLPP